MDEEVGWTFLLSKRWFGYYALIIVFAIVCVFLGNWQFDRRDQARAEIARIDTNYDAHPVPLNQALSTLNAFDIDENKWQPVVMRGEYIGEPFLARNRAGQGGVGSLLIHPLQLENGDLFFVDRGWVDVNAADGVPATLPMPHSGTVEVTVRLRESEESVRGRSNEGRTLGSLNLVELSQNFSQPAYTGAYGQLVTESPAGLTGELPPKPERDEGPHLSYALQWYVFIIIALGGAWYAATLEYRSLNSGSRRVRNPNVPTQRKPRRKGKVPTDEEEEDALIEGGP